MANPSVEGLNTDPDDEAPLLPAQTGINVALAARIIGQLTNDNGSDLEKVRTQGTAGIFAYLCDIINVDRSNIELHRRTSKGFLFNALKDAVSVKIFFFLIYIYSRR